MIDSMLETVADIPVALTCDVCNLKHVDDDALLWCLNDHAHGDEGVTLECRCPPDRVLAQEVAREGSPT